MPSPIDVNPGRADNNNYNNNNFPSALPTTFSSPPIFTPQNNVNERQDKELNSTPILELPNEKIVVNDR